MINHNNGTMEVLTNGVIEHRSYSVCKKQGMITVYMPEHSSDEEVFYSIGSDVPEIITRGRAP